MEKKYICYIYNLILGNDKIFLFGFVIKCDNFCFLDKLPVFNDSEIEISFSILDKNEYNEFINKYINDNIFSFDLLKQNGNDMDIKYISEAKLNKSKNLYSFISLHKFKKLFINDYDFGNIDMSNIVEKLKKYAAPFFYNDSIPIGTFYIMENNILFYNTPIKININIYSSEVHLSFDDSVLGNIARLIIYSYDEIIFDSIINIVNIDYLKNITVSMLPTGYSLEIFDETGESIYYENYHLLLEIDLKMHIMQNILSITDILSKKNKDLRNISLKDNTIHSKISYIDKINNTELKDYIIYNQYIKDKFINDRCDYTKFNASESYWFEKINSTECVNKMIELVKESDEAIFIDPYFDAFDDLNNKDNNMNSTQNMMVLINRLVGNITIITTSKNSDYLSSQLSNIYKLFELTNTNVILKTINNVKMHDRYLLLKRGNNVLLYSLTNSINSVMVEYPLGVLYIDILKNDKLREYIYNILNNSIEFFNMKDVIKNNKNKYKNKYIKYLVDDIENNSIDYVLKNNINGFIEKYNKLKNDDEIIAFLALSDTLSHINQNNYTILADIFNKDIELISDKTELLIKMEKYLFNNHYEKSGLTLTYSNSLLDIIKKDELSIENYIEISNALDYSGREIFGIYVWTIFIKNIYKIDPDSIVNYIKKSSLNGGELQILALDIIINKYFYLNENSNVNTNIMKMIFMYKVIDSIYKVNCVDINLIENKIDILKKLNIPNSIIFSAFIYSYIFFENGRTELNAIIDDFIKLNIFKNIINKSNISDIVKVLKNHNIVDFYILNKIINSDLIENNDVDTKIKLLNMYFEHNTNIWNTIFNDWNYIYHINILLYSLYDSKAVFKVLNNLLKINNISSIDDELLCVPIFDKIYNQYFYKNNLKNVCIILYLFTEIIEDSKYFIDKVITIYLNIHSGFIYVSELIEFIMLKGVFNCYYCDEINNINNNGFKQFLEELQKDNNLKVIYDIFNDYSNYSYNSLKLLFGCTDCIYKKSNMGYFLIDIIIEIIHSIFKNQIEDENKLKIEFDKLTDIINNILNDM
ncbi:VPA1262 family protein [Brachyspira hyodysenteriae]|uniref:VPA1262 family protein n=1 Tax=Brachyspira hyodysenteriae TaxID=159 RepID=UPI0022CDA7E5|nr:VPA1262 family protein [Brachyspira hyodysenteriae]MCZ9900633.1 VPA1262 family protein [Brachyspira hyodysenteriae]